LTTNSLSLKSSGGGANFQAGAKFDLATCLEKGAFAVRPISAGESGVGNRGVQFWPTMSTVARGLPTPAGQTGVLSNKTAPTQNAVRCTLGFYERGDSLNFNELHVSIFENLYVSGKKNVKGRYFLVQQYERVSPVFLVIGEETPRAVMGETESLSFTPQLSATFIFSRQC